MKIKEPNTLKPRRCNRGMQISTAADFIPSRLQTLSPTMALLTGLPFQVYPGTACRTRTLAKTRWKALEWMLTAG